MAAKKRISSTFQGMTEMVGIRRSMTDKEERQKLNNEEAVAMDTFNSKLTVYRNSFNPHQKYAPGFDYLNWKPYGVSRQENPSHTYVMTCKGLAPYVHSVVVAACAGIEERKWETLTVEGQQRISERVSRAASREHLDNE